MKRQQTCPICRQSAVKVGSSERSTRDGAAPSSPTSPTSPTSPSTSPSPPPSPQNQGESKNKATRLDEEYKRTEASLPSRPTSSSSTSASSSSSSCSSSPLRHRRRFGRTTHHHPYSGMEMAFRLASLQRQHPTYITNNDVNRWSSSSFSGNMENDQLFLERSPSYNRHQGTGHQGFSSSSGGDFGGGSSSGGGGGGGGW